MTPRRDVTASGRIGKVQRNDRTKVRLVGVRVWPWRKREGRVGLDGISGGKVVMAGRDKNRRWAVLGTVEED